MERIKSFLLDRVANSQLKTTNGAKPKIEQRTRNQLKKDFTDLLVEVLAEKLDDSLITVVRTEKGVGIAVDNENVGIIPIEISAMFKDLENDIVDMSEEYQEKLKLKAEKAEKDKKAKELKTAKQKELAEAKKRLKELQQDMEEGECEELE